MGTYPMTDVCMGSGSNGQRWCASRILSDANCSVTVSAGAVINPKHGYRSIEDAPLKNPTAVLARRVGIFDDQGAEDLIMPSIEVDPSMQISEFTTCLLSLVKSVSTFWITEWWRFRISSILQTVLQFLHCHHQWNALFILENCTWQSRNTTTFTREDSLEFLLECCRNHEWSCFGQ